MLTMWTAKNSLDGSHDACADGIRAQMQRRQTESKVSSAVEPFVYLCVISQTRSSLEHRAFVPI
jgi:hypothetical protein